MKYLIGCSHHTINHTLHKFIAQKNIVKITFWFSKYSINRTQTKTFFCIHLLEQKNESSTKQIVCKKTALPLSKRSDKIIKLRLRSHWEYSFQKEFQKTRAHFLWQKKNASLKKKIVFVPFWEVNASLKHVVDSWVLTPSFMVLPHKTTKVLSKLRWKRQSLALLLDVKSFSCCFLH